jgi:FHA domain
MGHEIAPGASYCPHGHPIALDAMPFANDQYGGGGYGQQPPQQGGFGAPPPQHGGFGAPQGGFGVPQGGFGAPPQPGYGGGTEQPPAYGQPFSDPKAPYGGGGYPPPGQQGGFGAPPPQQGFGGQPGYGGAPPPAQGGFGAPPPQPAFGGPQPGGFPGGQPDFGGAPQAAPPPAAPGAINLPPNALRGFLVSYQSSTQGDFWPLHGGRKMVGRANSGEQVDIPLADATISSRHAALIVDATAGSVQVEDTGSTNGTFVNEEHIGFNGKRDLRDGDKVRFGGFSTVIKVVTRL